MTTLWLGVGVPRVGPVAASEGSALTIAYLIRRDAGH
jgi:hypothetical protein